jgi:hypothetical protein
MENDIGDDRAEQKVTSVTPMLDIGEEWEFCEWMRVTDDLKAATQDGKTTHLMPITTKKLSGSTLFPPIHESQSHINWSDRIRDIQG